jgi:hypothetical protein
MNCVWYLIQTMLDKLAAVQYKQCCSLNLSFNIARQYYKCNNCWCSSSINDESRRRTAAGENQSIKIMPPKQQNSRSRCTGVQAKYEYVIFFFIPCD